METVCDMPEQLSDGSFCRNGVAMKSKTPRHMPEQIEESAVLSRVTCRNGRDSKAVTKADRGVLQTLFDMPEHLSLARASDTDREVIETCRC